MARHAATVVCVPGALALVAALAGCQATAMRPSLGATGRVLQLSIPAPSLAESTRVVFVYLPASYEGPDSTRRYPVAYFLHGGPGWNGNWLNQGSLPLILDSLIAARRIPGVIAVLPDGRGVGRRGMSLWADNWDGRSRMGTYLDRDVVAWTDRTFRTLALPSQRALIGISDGADAAVRHLLRAPEEYGAAAGLSGRYRPHGRAGLEAIAGSEPEGSRRLARLAPLTFVDSVAAAARGHFIYLDAGLLDNTAGDCLELDERLRALGIAHEAHLYVGWHEWFWWRRRLPAALIAVTRHFSASSRPLASAQKR